MADHVYHWKHGWIPLDHAAALQKAKGSHSLAVRYLNDATSGGGINSRSDVAKALTRLPDIGHEGDRAAARRKVSEAAVSLNAVDVIPSPLRTQSERLAAKAAEKRAEAQRASGAASVGDRAAGRLGADTLRRVGANTDRQLAKHAQAQQEAAALEHKAALARAREADAARTHLTADDIKGAKLVRTRHGWHEVVRVNKKTVTVKTPYSWTDNIDVGKILGVHKGA